MRSSRRRWLEVNSVAEAAEKADVIMILLPDERQKQYMKQKLNQT